jgi:small GTP-binding protein
MGPILARLLSRSFRQLEHDVLLLGLEGAGKSTILHKLNENNDLAVIEDFMEQLFYRNMRIVSWDLTGSLSRRKFYENWPNLGGLIFVLDSSDHNRLETAKKEFFEFSQLRKSDEFPVLIFCNKQDLPEALSVNEIVNFMKIDDSNMCCLAQGLCSLTGDGIHEGFNWLENNIA